MPKLTPRPSRRKTVSLRARRRRRNKKRKEQAERTREATASKTATGDSLMQLTEDEKEEAVSLDSPTTLHIADVFKTYSRKRPVLSPSLEDLPDLLVEVSTHPEDEIIQGRRIVSLQYVLEQHAKIVLDHKLKCTGGRMELQKEVRRGVFSILTFHCKMCDTVEKLYTDPQDKQPSINDSLTWAATAIGIGHTQAEEMLGILDVPILSAASYRSHENKVGELLIAKLKEKMELAIQEEIQLAREEGHVDEGKVWISVTLDGSWGKRTYGHGYNSNSGLACIIGTRTQKLLYMDTKNKFCMTCSLGLSQGKEVREHECNRNFSGSSTSMEYTIIVEGLKKLHIENNVWARYVIADGDSNVYQKIRQLTPRGCEVVKRECANHVTRCYTGNLHKLLQDTSIDILARNILREKIPRLTSAVRGAIRQNEGNEVEQLRSDLRNGPKHVFGSHLACRETYCTRKNTEENNFIPILEKSGLLEKINYQVEKVVQKSDRLTTNETTNAAENLMSLVCKFTGAKRVDYAKGRSYHRRCVMAGLAHTGGLFGYVTSPWKLEAGTSPGAVTKKLVQKRQERNSKRKLHYDEELEDGRKKNKKKKRSAPPDKHYGATLEQQPDISNEDRKRNEQEILERLKVEVKTAEDTAKLEQATVGQNNRKDDAWCKARRYRLTASKFGVVCKRAESTLCDKLVKQIIVPPLLRTYAVLYGQRHEESAKKQYEEQYKVKVKSCGIFVPHWLPWIGASPDGLVLEDGLVEVKCIPSLGNNSIESAANNSAFRKHLPVQYVRAKEGRCQLELKKSHNYYYQIQGQLAVTTRKWCDLLLYWPGGFKCLRIHADQNFWLEKMLPKLERFYMLCLLPELADSRSLRGLPCREPEYIVNARANKEKNNLKNSKHPKKTVL